MYDVITIGTATRDVFLESPLFKVLKDPEHLERLGFKTGEAQCFAFGAKIEVGKPVMTTGGGAANTAVTFARQGLSAAAVVKIGADENGAAILRGLKRERVAVLALRDRRAMTGYSVVLLAENGERTILNHRGASEEIKRGDAPSSKMKARWAYIVPGRIPLPVMTALVKRLARNGARIAMNPSRYYLELGSRRLRPILNQLAVILVNREEGAYLTGFHYGEERKIFRKFDELVRGIAVVTDGPRGVAVSDGSRVYRAGIFREKKVADRTGAGDAFGSGFVAGLMRENSNNQLPISKFTEEEILNAIRLGSANATSVVESIGAQPGILTASAFAREKRWRRLPIQVKKI